MQIDFDIAITKGEEMKAKYIEFVELMLLDHPFNKDGLGGANVRGSDILRSNLTVS